MNKYTIIIGCLVIIAVVAAVGGAAGYTVDGVPVSSGLETSRPGILGVVSWVWNSLAFLFTMMTFQVDGMPWWIVMVFYIMSMMVAYVIVNLVRGTD